MGERPIDCSVPFKIRAGICNELGVHNFTRIGFQ
jgi:hypothetical protein